MLLFKCLMSAQEMHFKTFLLVCGSQRVGNHRPGRRRAVSAEDLPAAEGH